MAREREDTLLGVIHCAATPPGMEDVNIRDVHRWHYQRGIYSPTGLSGYHAFIKRNGDMEIGRPLMEQGAHALGHNDVSVSVCLAGGVEEDGKTPEDNFTVEQWTALQFQVEFWWHTWPGLIICGHRDLGAPKACPSFDVHDWLLVHFDEEIAERNRGQLAEYMAAYRKRRDT